MKIASTMVLPLALLGMSTLGFAGPLDEVHIRGISYGGNGCPQGSVGELLAADKQSFTLLFDEYIAEIGPDVERKNNRKFCQITLDLHVPQGWQYTVATFDYRGYADLDRGVSGTQTSLYYFDNAREGKFSSTFRGDYQGDYKFTDAIGIESVVWSRCGEKKLLNIKTDISLRSSSRNASGLMTTDSIDGNVKQKYGVQWRRC